MQLVRDLNPIILIASLLVIAGCQSTVKPESDQSAQASPITAQPSTSPKPRTMNSPLSYKVVNFGYTPLEEGFHPQPKAMVFQDQQAWTAFWKTSQRLDANLQSPAAPKVDFKQQTIVGITPGSRRTGGYSVKVDRVELSQEKGGDRILVHYSESTPGEGCMVTQATTTPTVFISMPKTTLPVKLQGRQVAVACQ